MGRNISTSHLNAGLRELFSATAIPDILWSDRGPQFTSREFRSFADQWASTIRPQRRTIHRVMVGRGISQVNEENNSGCMEWQMYKLCRALYSIGTHHQGRMACHQHKSCMATLSKMHSLLITALLPLCGSVVARKHKNKQRSF